MLLCTVRSLFGYQAAILLKGTSLDVQALSLLLSGRLQVVLGGCMTSLMQQEGFVGSWAAVPLKGTAVITFSGHHLLTKEWHMPAGFGLRSVQVIWCLPPQGVVQEQCASLLLCVKVMWHPCCSRLPCICSVCRSQGHPGSCSRPHFCSVCRS